jgi:ferredoxin-NADP reductase
MSMSYPVLPTGLQYKLNRHVTTIVKRCWRETADVRVLELADPEGWDLPPFKAGAHIDVILPDSMTRQYSLCGDAFDRKTYRIAVRREASGRGGSMYVHGNLQQGSRVSVSLPRNLFPLENDAVKHLFIAGGIGLTPFMSMIPALLHEGKMFHLHVCTKHRIDTPFLADLDAWARLGMVTFHHSGEKESTRLDMSDLLKEQSYGTHVYFCGPSAMLDMFLQATTHWTEGSIHYERFGGAAPQGKAYLVRLFKSNVTVEVNSNETMSAAIKRAGVFLRTSCEAGICGMCKVRYSEGEPDHNDHCLSREARTDTLTPCVSGCRSESLTIDL